MCASVRQCVRACVRACVACVRGRFGLAKSLRMKLLLPKLNKNKNNESDNASEGNGKNQNTSTPKVAMMEALERTTTEGPGLSKFWCVRAKRASKRACACDTPAVCDTPTPRAHTGKHVPWYLTHTAP